MMYLSCSGTDKLKVCAINMILQSQLCQLCEVREGTLENDSNEWDIVTTSDGEERSAAEWSGVTSGQPMSHE